MSFQEKLSKAERKQLVTWAKAAVHGLDESAIFCAVMNDAPLDAARVEFTLQIGHALLTGKPIVLTVPHGVPIPAKLEAAADRIVRYDVNDPKSMQPGIVQALTELGINTQ